MRSVGIIGAIGLVMGLSVPAFAAEETAPELFPMSQLANVQEMTDQQLTEVEGMSYVGHHGYPGSTNQANHLMQANFNSSCGCWIWGGGPVYQNNGATQVNDASGRHGRIDQSNWASQMNTNYGGGFVQQGNSAYQSNR